MSGFFRFDILKQQRKDSFDSVKSPKSPSCKSPSAGPSRSQSIQSEPAGVEATPANPTRPKARRNWSFGRVLDEETQQKRRESQDEKDRLYFAAARKYSNACRRSQGAGVGFEGGWQ